GEAAAEALFPQPMRRCTLTSAPPPHRRRATSWPRLSGAAELPATTGLPIRCHAAPIWRPTRRRRPMSGSPGTGTGTACGIIGSRAVHRQADDDRNLYAGTVGAASPGLAVGRWPVE